MDNGIDLPVGVTLDTIMNSDYMKRACEALDKRGHKLVSNQVVYSIQYFEPEN